MADHALDDLRRAVRDVCGEFPSAYWQGQESQGRYPHEFVRRLTELGYLAVLIPEKYGGAGLGIEEASVILEEINRSGANAGACHAQMYTMGILLRHGSEEQRRAYLPRIASGEARLQAFAVTEPSAGSDTTRIQTTAVRRGDRYVVNGEKIFISRAQHSDYMILLARTTPLKEVRRRSEGLSVFLIDVPAALKSGLTLRPIHTMINHETNSLHFDNLEVPAENLVGKENEGFRYVLDGMNAERILIAAECVGDGRWFVERAVAYAKERIVFDRPIGQNQGIAFPISRAYANVRAADLMRKEAARLFDADAPCGEEANLAKLIASEASWEAANAAVQTFGGYGFASEMDVERKFRETRLYQVAPISTNLILSYVGEHVLGLPRSY